MSIVLDGSNLTTTGVPNSGTAVASTSGTSIDFTGIPAGTKRIIVMLNGVSTNGTATLMIQVGSGSFITSGYNYYAVVIQNTTASAFNNSTGFSIDGGGSSFLIYGTMTLNLIQSNSWVSSGNGGSKNSTLDRVWSGGGSVSLSGALDRVRVTTTNGTDTFDAGSINILYE